MGVLTFAFWLIVRYSEKHERNESDSRHSAKRNFGIVLPEKHTIHGIDVSRHQEIIDWKKVDIMKSGGKEISFAFIKATEGIGRTDQYFSRNWKQIKKTNLIRGAYHFYYPSRDARKQALNFISQVRLMKGDLPPVVDIEHTGGKSKKRIIEGLTVFLKTVKKHYFITPVIYTNHSFYNNYLTGEFDDYPLWISYYIPEDQFHSKCDYAWSFWQHSETGKVDGIEGNVDFNVFSGSMAELQKLCKR
jgi:lysozyme